jgi:glycine/D-amino acid oxidase-like deaminating enzyme
VEDEQVHQSLLKRNKSSRHDRDNDAEWGDGITSSIVLRKRKKIQQDMSTLMSSFKLRTRVASQDLSTLESTAGMDDDTILLRDYDHAANLFDEVFEEEDIEEQASDDDLSYRHSDGGGSEEEEEAEQEEAAASSKDELEDDREIEPGLIDSLVGKCDVM